MKKITIGIVIAVLAIAMIFVFICLCKSGPRGTYSYTFLGTTGTMTFSGSKMTIDFPGYDSNTIFNWYMEEDTIYIYGDGETRDTARGILRYNKDADSVTIVTGIIDITFTKK